MMLAERVRHSWPEAPGFVLTRNRGSAEYVLLHFHTPCVLRVGIEEHVTKPGSFIVIPPRTAQFMYCTEPLSHDWMHITGDVKKGMERYGLTPGTLYQLRHSNRITSYTEQLEFARYADLPYYPEMSEALLNAIFIFVAHDIMRSTSAVHLSKEVIERLKDVHDDMMFHPNRDWTVESIARFVGVSASRLFPAYKSLFGVSPNKDVINMRVERAKTLLLQGMSVAETAENSGYGNVYHFIRQFKQVTGVTPKEYVMR